MADRPAASRGAWVGVVLVLTALALNVALALALRHVWPGPTAAVLFVALIGAALFLAVLAYWLVGLVTLRYGVSRDGVILHWAGSRTTIPMGDITHVLNGRPYGEPLRGLRWPGYELGRTTLVTDDGVNRPLVVFATAPPERQLVLVTSDLAYAISPADRASFVEEFKRRLRMGPVQQLPHGTSHPLASRLGLARDGVALQLLAGGLCANALAFAWLIWQYPTLPAKVALWHAVGGGPESMRLHPPVMAWQLPAMGLVTLALNAALAGLVASRARLGARLLLLGAVVLQITVLVTMMHLVP
jgi:hypothetical protein